MKNHVSSLLPMLFAVACGAIGVKVVEPTVAQAVPGQFKECYAQPITRSYVEKPTATQTPPSVTIVPNGWTVVTGGAEESRVYAILCR